MSLACKYPRYTKPGRPNAIESEYYIIFRGKEETESGKQQWREHKYYDLAYLTLSVKTICIFQGQGQAQEGKQPKKKGEVEGKRVR
jgi:hypothetical protein